MGRLDADTHTILFEQLYRVVQFTAPVAKYLFLNLLLLFVPIPPTDYAPPPPTLHTHTHTTQTHPEGKVVRLLFCTQSFVSNQDNSSHVCKVWLSCLAGLFIVRLF